MSLHFPRVQNDRILYFDTHTFASGRMQVPVNQRASYFRCFSILSCVDYFDISYCKKLSAITHDICMGVSSKQEAFTFVASSSDESQLAVNDRRSRTRKQHR